jgi:opacity protein-like surface antigen
MKKKIIKLMSVGFLMLGAGTTVYAAASGFYIGGQAGKSYAQNKKQTVQVGDPDDLEPLGTETLSPDNTGVGERIFVGFNLNEYFALEGGFTHYAPSVYTVPAEPELTIGNPVGKPAIAQNGFDFVGKGILPIWTSGFNVFGKAGVAFIRQSKAGTFTTTYNEDQDALVQTSGTTTYVRPTAGIGVGYDLTQNWVIDLTEAHVFGGGGLQSLDLISIGISYHFVDKYCGQFLC